jgi:hypothetical protein
MLMGKFQGVIAPTTPTCEHDGIVMQLCTGRRKSFIIIIIIIIIIITIFLHFQHRPAK